MKKLNDEAECLIVSHRNSDDLILLAADKGRVLASFKMGINERFLLSSCGGEIISRRLAQDEQFWSKDTLEEVIQEMLTKN